MIDEDYGAGVNINKWDNVEIEIDNRTFRSFYDGSNEAWNPTLYNLNSEFADWDDNQIYVTRSNSTVEYTQSLGEKFDIIIGWDQWIRNGKETLLRGSRAIGSGGNPTIRSIPALADVDGVSDTYYFKIPIKVMNKYNLDFTQSYEYYRDDQDIRHYRYTAAGALQQARTFQDYPNFKDLTTTLKADGFVTENLYLTTGYMFDFVNNESERSSVRPNLANPSHFVNPDVNNKRKSNVFNISFAWLKNKIKGMQVRGGLRAESADTDARGSGWAGGTNHREAQSNLNETRLAESVCLSYKAIPMTTISVNADFEQRDLDWSEYFDARSHEIVTNFNGPNFMIYETDIRYNDQKYTFNIVNKPCKRVKLGLKYKHKKKDRDYDVSNDTSALFYPGVLIDQDQTVKQLVADIKVRFSDKWNTTIKYENINDNIAFGSIRETTQKMDISRYSISTMGNVAPRLSLLFTGTLENYFLNTPVEADPGTSWEVGEGVYDYDGDYYLASAVLNYAFASNNAWLTAGYQQTASQGTNKNILHEFYTSLRHNFEDDGYIDLRYEVFDFNDNSGGGFDDYNGHGFSVSVKKTF